jgi:hypothetical protein
MGNINNVITIPTSTEGKFFRYWLEFLRPFHKLTERETDVMASFLKQRYELSKVIKDQEVLNKYTMNEETKRKVREECGITQAHFQVIMTKLKKSKMIDNGRINPKFIPRVEEDAKNFLLLLSFNLQ